MAVPGEALIFTTAIAEASITPEPLFLPKT
jgi:hypothetical protein